MNDMSSRGLPALRAEIDAIDDAILALIEQRMTIADEVAAMKDALPKMMFVLVPFFAALVALVFRSRRMHYPQHLAFALHVHAFMFVALLPTLAAGLIRNDGVKATLAGVSVVAIAAYFVLSVRRVYATTVAGAIARGVAISGIYLLAYGVAVAIAFFALVFLRF